MANLAQSAVSSEVVTNAAGATVTLTRRGDGGVEWTNSLGRLVISYDERLRDLFDQLDTATTTTTTTTTTSI